jgi:hypothetical protein
MITLVRHTRRRSELAAVVGHSRVLAECRAPVVPHKYVKRVAVVDGLVEVAELTALTYVLY